MRHRVDRARLRVVGPVHDAPIAGVSAPCSRRGIPFKRAQFQRFPATVAALGRGDGNPVIVAGAGLAADARAGIAHSSPKPRPRASSAARSDADAPV